MDLKSGYPYWAVKNGLMLIMLQNFKTPEKMLARKAVQRYRQQLHSLWPPYLTVTPPSMTATADDFPSRCPAHFPFTHYYRNVTLA
jgi:hypothetical protein